MRTTWIAVSALAIAGIVGLPPSSQADVRFGVGVVVGGGPRSRGAFGFGLDRGFEDGYRYGNRDARAHRRFDPWRHGRYRSGTHGYRGRYGARWDYVSGYRSGFERGYRDAYDALWGRRGRGYRDERRGYRDDRRGYRHDRRGYRHDHR
jgi:hypothetical protein